MNGKRIASRNHQQGVALVVGLMLLVVITVLAVSGMNTATTELALARNDQAHETAFQTAENGLAQALASGKFNTLRNTTLSQNVTQDNRQQFAATIRYEDSTLVPDRAFSLGVGSGIAAHHFLATSQAAFDNDPGNTTDRDATAVHTQAFYVVGPEPPTL
ncbi:MAG: PilX N-terminal domain-containing pilus assembly protein [Woeseiaceae bacterium]|nr:PilX N-terminal domain-containing pilus assembly protein [Woeseiaceae bacterium]